MIGGFFQSFFFHPFWGAGYQFWSGIAGSFLTSVPGWLAFFVVYGRRHNCHVKGCWRLQWHAHPDHGHLVCRKHHPAGDGIEADA